MMKKKFLIILFNSFLFHAQNNPTIIVFEGDSHGIYLNEVNDILISNTVSVDISGLISSPNIVIKPNGETAITISAMEQEDYDKFRDYDILSGGTTTITSRGTGGLGRDGNQTESIKFYPNPTKDILIIESDFYDMIGYSLFDYSGNLMEKNLLHNIKKHTLNLEDYKNSHYILEINFKNNQKKIIKIIKK